MKDLGKMRVFIVGLVIAFAGVFVGVTPSVAAGPVPAHHIRESVTPYHGMPGTMENDGLFWDSVTGQFFGFDPTQGFDYRVGRYDRDYAEFDYRTPGVWWNAQIGHWQSHFEFYEDRGFTPNDPTVPMGDPDPPPPAPDPTPTSDPSPSSTPVATVDPTPTSSASPTPTSTSSPSPSPTPDPTPVDNSGMLADCISIDPFKFKLDVPCIVNKLFVPSPEKKDKMNAQIDTLINTRFPFSYIVGFKNTILGLVNMTAPECVPLTVDVSGYAGQPAKMELFPCNAQFASVFRPLTFWLFGFIIVMICGQWVWSLFRPTLPSERG